MTILDMRTILLLSVITGFICTLFIVQLWRHNRGRFDGMAFLVLDFALQTTALTLIVLRGAITDWLSIVLANLLIIAGAIAGYVGLERFVGKRGPQSQNLVLLVLLSGAFVYFTFLHPDLRLRTLMTSAGLLIISVQCLWLLWIRVERTMRPLTFGIGMVFGGYGLVSGVRVVEYFVGAPGAGDYFQSGAFQALVLVAYEMLFILLTYVLVLMVNKRLLLQISAQEEKFAKAFHSAPYAIVITRLPDGTIADVNDRFKAMTGYDRAELLGQKTMDLRIWEDGKDRAAVLKTLSKVGRVDGMELRFRKKSGEAVTGLFSAVTITIDGAQCVLSSVGDITDRKRMEEALRESERKYRELSIVDDLTQLYNSRHFYSQLKLELGRTNRYGQPLTLLLLDLDNFKTFNDTYGHIEGDQVLWRLGQVVKRCLRETDSAYRYGGEEFTILLPMTTSADGAVTAERIRKEFKKETFTPAPGQEVHVTVSIGLGQYKPQEDMKTFVQRVDQLMYQGKKGGKDRTCSEEGPPEPFGPAFPPSS